MSYTKHDWIDGNPPSINAKNLQEMDDQIYKTEKDIIDLNNRVFDHNEQSKKIESLVNSLVAKADLSSEEIILLQNRIAQNTPHIDKMKEDNQILQSYIESLGQDWYNSVTPQSEVSGIYRDIAEEYNTVFHKRAGSCDITFGISLSGSYNTIKYVNYIDRYHIYYIPTHGLPINVVFNHGNFANHPRLSVMQNKDPVKITIKDDQEWQDPVAGSQVFYSEDINFEEPHTDYIASAEIKLDILFKDYWGNETEYNYDFGEYFGIENEKDSFRKSYDFEGQDQSYCSLSVTKGNSDIVGIHLTFSAFTPSSTFKYKLHIDGVKMSNYSMPRYIYDKDEQIYTNFLIKDKVYQLIYDRDLDGFRVLNDFPNVEIPVNPSITPTEDGSIWYVT